jgi:hypothetical protein
MKQYDDDGKKDADPGSDPGSDEEAEYEHVQIS